MVVKVEIFFQHKLSPQMTFLEGQLLFGGVEITSIEMGMQYMRLLHNNKAVEALEMTRDPKCQWQPQMAIHYVEKYLADVTPNCWFEMRIDRVLETIFTAQLTDERPYNPFREAIRRVIDEAGDQPIDFVYHSNASDRVLSIGHKCGGNPTCITTGRDIYGRTLSRVVEMYRNPHTAGSLDAKRNLQILSDMVCDKATFDSVFTRSVLIITDSQGRMFGPIGHGGQVVAVSGATYADIGNVLCSGRYELHNYAVILFYVGTNCGIKADYTESKREAEIHDLLTVLRDVVKDRLDGSVVYCEAVANPRRRGVDRHHLAHVCEEFERIGVKCLKWADFPEAFRNARGGLDRSLFAKDDLHLNENGSHVLWKYLADKFPKIGTVSYTVRDEPYSHEKREFEGAMQNHLRNCQPAYQPQGDRSPITHPKVQRFEQDQQSCSYRAGSERNVRYRTPTEPVSYKMRSVCKSPIQARRRSPARASRLSPMRQPIKSPLRSRSRSRDRKEKERSSRHRERRRSAERRGDRDRERGREAERRERERGGKK